jgi:hypothetical protein
MLIESPEATDVFVMVASAPEVPTVPWNSTAEEDERTLKNVAVPEALAVAVVDVNDRDMDPVLGVPCDAAAEKVKVRSAVLVACCPSASFAPSGAVPE